MAEMEETMAAMRVELGTLRAEVTDVGTRLQRTAMSSTYHEGIIGEGFRAHMEEQEEILTATRRDLQVQDELLWTVLMRIGRVQKLQAEGARPEVAGATAAPAIIIPTSTPTTSPAAHPPG